MSAANQGKATAAQIQLGDASTAGTAKADADVDVDVDADAKQKQKQSNASGGAGIKNVLFRWTLKRISEIDTSKQRFYVEFTSRFTWVAEEFEIESIERALKMTPKELYDWDPVWIPQITFPNALDVTLGRINIGRAPYFIPKKLVSPEDGSVKYTITYDMEIRAWFMEFFELETYPFDCQELTLIMKMGNTPGMERYRLIPDTGMKGTFSKMDLLYSVFQEWNLKPSILGVGYTDPKQSKSLKSYSITYIKLKCQRKYQYYIKRIGLILALLSLSSLMSFGIDIDDLGDRVANVVTLELAIVAFQFTINDRLPVVSFLTFIDQYMLWSLFYVFAVGCANVFIAQIPDSHHHVREKWDVLLFYIFLVVWVIFHAVAAVYVKIGVKREKEKLKRKNNDFTKSLLNSAENEVTAHHFRHDDKEMARLKKGKWATYTGLEIGYDGEIVQDSSDEDSD